ncbi:TylF/MycF/NovP-related O-methyltransferase [Rhizobium mayense]|uniref:TylF/MycF/NovP-related O-methyltransferase n=1 Tax=Rhizobium mayense TaxID=1312184 RepID=A0ABT7K8U0_9HYPH|nr:TylF/MycF/NovP-related O-methyltransferase [Rhizobium mayense]MDL2403564.1 TylF/MycF/NovP-related O-methyltransferase [Rhizobium mayense]
MNVPSPDSPQFVQFLAVMVEQILGNPRGDAFNLDTVARLSAAVSSSQYLYSRMIGAKRLNSALELLDYAVSCAVVEGLTLEFGVFSGRSINRIAQGRSGPVYGFDSFEGLPEDWREGYDKGAFGLTGLPAVASNVELVVGWFDRTLPQFLDAHPGPASLVHVDCDLYSSTQTVLTQLRERFVPGTIIIFDEYFNYPGWEMHEFKAFKEFVESVGLQYEYIALNPNHQQVVVRVTGVHNRRPSA